MEHGQYEQTYESSLKPPMLKNSGKYFKHFPSLQSKLIVNHLTNCKKNCEAELSLVVLSLLNKLLKPGIYNTYYRSPVSELMICTIKYMLNNLLFSTFTLHMKSNKQFYIFIHICDMHAYQYPPKTTIFIPC